MAKIIVPYSTQNACDNHDLKIPEGWEKNFTILGVDDDPLCLRALHHLLSQSGFNFKLVSTGKQCLEELGSEKYNLIILDLEMPAPNGFDCAKIIREREKLTGKHIAIIAYSACGNLFEEKAFLAGCDSVLIKPVPIVVFHEILKKHLLNGVF